MPEFFFRVGHDPWGRVTSWHFPSLPVIITEIWIIPYRPGPWLYLFLLSISVLIRIRRHYDQHVTLLSNGSPWSGETRLTYKFPF